MISDFFHHSVLQKKIHITIKYIFNDEHNS